MVHQVLAYNNKKIRQFENSALLKNSVNLKEITWIRIRIKIKWILSTVINKQIKTLIMKLVEIIFIIHHLINY